LSVIISKKISDFTEEEFYQSVLDNLSSEESIPNFYALCDKLGITRYNGAKQKALIEAHIRRFVDFSMKGRKIIINNVYDVPVPKAKSNSYAHNFAPMFFYYLGKKVKSGEEIFKTGRTFIATTAQLASEIGMYNMLWEYMYLFRNYVNRPLIGDFNKAQSDALYKIVESDMNTIMNNICYNGLSTLAKQKHAVIIQRTVYHNKDGQKLVPVERKVEVDFLLYYNKALREGNRPLVALQLANERRNEKWGTDDFIHKAWEIAMDNATIEKFVNIDFDERCKYESFLQDKRIIKLENKFKSSLTGWGDHFVFTKDAFDDVLFLAREIATNVELNKEENRVFYDIINKDSEVYQKARERELTEKMFGEPLKAIPTIQEQYANILAGRSALD